VTRTVAPRTIVDIGEFLRLPAFARRITESACVPIDVPGIADVLITEAPKQENKHRSYENISDHRADEIEKAGERPERQSACRSAHSKAEGHADS